MHLFLEILKDGKPKQRIVVKDGESYIGRADDCKIRIPSSNVSRKHCKITLKDRLAFIVDLQSVNGTFVNGRKIKGLQTIVHADKIFIGKLQLSLEGVTKDLSEELAICAKGITKVYLKRNGEDKIALTKMDISKQEILENYSLMENYNVLGV